MTQIAPHSVALKLQLQADVRCLSRETGSVGVVRWSCGVRGANADDDMALDIHAIFLSGKKKEVGLCRAITIPARALAFCCHAEDQRHCVRIRWRG